MRTLLGFFFAATIAVGAVNVGVSMGTGRRLGEADAAQLESSLSGKPDQMEIRAKLLGYYAEGTRDSSWSNRLRLVSWEIQNHPDSELLAMPAIWMGLPDSMVDQMKQMWVAQVHQHADNAQVLRNAAWMMGGNFKPAGPLIRVGGSVQEKSLVTQVPPVYPALARQARIQGTVRFNVTIAADGKVANVTLISGHPLLVSAAQEALVQWVYKPTLLNGQPAAVITTVDINFTLTP